MSRYSTLRLPAPPLPPKPLHLTTKRIETIKPIYPSIPNFVPSDDEGEEDSADRVLEGEEEEEEEEETWWGSSVLKRSQEEDEQESTISKLLRSEGESENYPNSNISNRRITNNQDLNEEEDVATIKFRSETKGIGARSSIYFDSSQPNPFTPSSTITTSPSSSSSIEGNPQLELTSSSPAISLHSFEGRLEFGELIFDGGLEMRIEVEDLGGGWSLGYLVSEGEAGRGLIPRGWYAYLEEEEEMMNSEDGTLETSEPTLSIPLLPIESQIIDQKVKEKSPEKESFEFNNNRVNGGGLIIISGVEFEPVDTEFEANIPSWLKPVESFDMKKEKIELGLEEDLNIYELVMSQAEDRADVEKDLESVSKEELDVESTHELEKSKDLPDLVSESVTVSETLPKVAPNTQSTKSEIEPIPSKSQILPTASPSTLSIPSRILSIQSQKSIPLLSTTNLTSTTATPVSLTRSFSLLGLYRIGSNLGRTYSLSSIGLNGRNSLNSLPGLSLEGKVLGLVDDWIKRGGDLIETKEEGDEVSAKYFIENGPIWKSGDSSRLIVHIHSPEKKRAIGKTSEHIIYTLSTTIYDSVLQEEVIIEVERRYSHFLLLRTLLLDQFPILSIPQLPSKTYSGSFKNEFIESRKAGLEIWCNWIGRHPILKGSDELKGFLGLEQDSDLKLLLSPNERIEKSTKFFETTFHPDFNFDIDDAKEIGQSFQSLLKSMESMKGLGNRLEEFKESNFVEGSTLRSFARALYQIIDNPREDLSGRSVREEEDSGVASSLAKAVQAAAESLFEVTNVIEENAGVKLKLIGNFIQGTSSALSNHSPLLEIHKLAISTFEKVQLDPPLQHELELSRCETIINITLAEIDQVQKLISEDLKKVAEDFLDSQIELHQTSLENLFFAKSHFSEPNFTALSLTGKRLPSRVFAVKPTAPRYGALTRKLDPRDLIAGVLQSHSNVNEI